MHSGNRHKECLTAKIETNILMANGSHWRKEKERCVKLMHSSAESRWFCLAC
jgi:hypothetical protein